MLISYKGEKTKGFWIDGKINGKGTHWSISSGTTYEGNWMNGVK
jgi:hypothetical protein